MEKQEQEPEHKKEQEQRHKEEQEQEQNQPTDHEQQHMHPNPDPPPKLNSPPREPEVRQANPSSLRKKGSPPREPELRQANPSSLPKKGSPPREPELRQANPGSPPKKPSPPRLPYLNSTPKSPPLGEDDDEEEKEVKKPPSILPLPPPVAMAAVETKMEPTSQEVQDEENGLGGGVDAHGHGDGFVNTGSGRKFLKYNLSILKKAKRDNMMNRALIVSRISGFVFSLVSFSILAADRDRGWAIDSFYRYKEFRYCLAVNIIAFVYSGFQGYDLIYKLNYGKRKEKQPVRQYIDFSLDQVITYLLISASSSAAVRIDDWQSNWGKDPFPDMARASVALSFLAFVALALSSLVSGYKVYTLKSS